MFIRDLIAGSVPWIIPAILVASFLVNNKESLPKKSGGKSKDQSTPAKGEEQLSDKDMTG